MRAAAYDSQLPAAASIAVAKATTILAALCLVTVLVCLRLPESILAILEYDRSAILGGDVWRLWTGHLVHFSTQHAMTDSIALLFAGYVAIRIFHTGRFWFHFCWIAPMISVGLMLWSPTLQLYRGLSGLVVALTVLGAAELCRTHAPSRPWIAFFGLLMALKTIAEANGMSGNLAWLPTGVEVEWRAHVLGTVGAIVVATWRSLSTKHDRLVICSPQHFSNAQRRILDPFNLRELLRSWRE